MIAGVYDPRRGRTALQVEGSSATAVLPGTAISCHLDGEVYNASRLANELGLPPDTEAASILAAGWRSAGDAFLGGLRGSFVLVLWDAERRSGLLAEDHGGLRTCVMHEHAGVLRFAGSMRALLDMLPTRPGPDEEAMVTFVGLSRRPPLRTLAEGVTRVGAGRLIAFADGRWRRAAYWTPTYVGTRSGSRPELAEGLREALERSIALRLDDERPTGVILSGGFDSTAVAGVATSLLGGRPALRGYSAVFPDAPEIDETDRIDAFTAARGVQSMRLSPRPQGALRSALEYLDTHAAPVAGPGYAFERPLLERAAADGVRVVLDGQGGDEVFAFSPFVLADRIRRLRLIAALRLLRAWPGFEGRRPVPAQVRYVLREMALRPALPYPVHNRLRRRGDRARHGVPWVTGRNAEVLFEADDGRAWKRRSGGPLWWKLLADLLTDWRSASGGLAEYVGTRGAGLPVQSRAPLLDVDLVEFALSLPPEAAMGIPNRSLARASVRGLVPDAVRLSPSKSNIGPFYAEMLTRGDFAVVRRLLGARDARVYAYADREYILAALERAPGTQAPGWLQWTTLLWHLLGAELWLRQLEDDGFAAKALEAADLPPIAFDEPEAPPASGGT